MANNIANRGAGAIMQQSAVFDQLPEEWDDLTAGVTIGFPIISIKSGKWHYRFKGEDQIIMDAQGRFPTPAIQVVMIKAQKELSRTFYASGYVEGVNNPPDCWSSDGVRPDETVAYPINPVCATCPNDAWGSGASPAAPKAKACQQRRRIVVVPYSSDLTNEMGGGPCLLSVPPGSLANLVSYSDELRKNQVNYVSGITELSFSQDPNIAFAKIEFRRVGALSDTEAKVVYELRKHEQVERIINTKMIPAEMEPTTNPEEAPATATAPPPPPQPATTARPAPRPSVVRPPQPAQPAPAPAPAPVAQAAPPPPPPPAQAAPPPPTATRVGGFPMQPARQAAPPPPPPPPPAGTIAGAMRTPAPPPPTQRPLVKEPPQAVKAEAAYEPEDDVHPDGPAPSPDANEPEMTEGAMPTDMNALFNNLMKAG